MSSHDAATAFTLQYLELLERHLNVSWSAAEIPVCITDWIRDEAVDHLRDDLARLIHSDLERDARQATVEYGVEHLQTVGFGLAPDFDQFIKLGLIYGERVVLWDVIHSRILTSDQSYQDRKSLLAQVACSLLMLKATVARGGVVVLAHPIEWSPLAAEIDSELRAAGPVPAASLGLSIAFAAIESGLPLHPYTLLAGGSKPSADARVGQLEDQLFSSENYRFQQCVTALLRDTRVAYLDDVRVEDFFGVVSRHSKLRRALRKHFALSFSGLSPQQATAETSALVDDLFDLFDKRNAAVVDYAAEGVDATAKFALASVSSTVLGLPLLGALAALGPLAVHLSTAVRKWNKKPERNVIIQAFHALEQSATATQAYDPVSAEYQLANFRHGQSSLGELYVKFMGFHWTEHRHTFLKSLSPEVAKSLLALLSSEDLEIIVNHRQFQEDYIGDYLAYVSWLDEAIYWEHLGKTFESSQGLLIYDDDAHIEFMETKDMPLKAWNQLLDSLFDVYADEMRSGEYEYPLERFPGIVRFQTVEARHVNEKRLALVSLSSSLDPVDQQALMRFVAQAFDGVAPGWLTGG